MSVTFAQDAVHRVCTRLDAIQDRMYAQASLASSQGSTVPASAIASLTNDSSENQSVQQTVSQLEGILAKDVLHEKSLPTIKQLQDSLQSLKTFQFQASALLTVNPAHRAKGKGNGAPSGASSSQLAAAQDEVALAEVMAVARLTYAVYGVLLERLLEQAERVNDQAWYWTGIEDNVGQAALYFVQTFPARAMNLVLAVGRRIAETTQATQGNQNHVLTSSAPRRDLHLAFNKAMVKQGIQMVRDSPALAIGAMFPLAVRSIESDSADSEKVVSQRHSGRVIIVSEARTSSPLALVRHEAKMKRARLLEERDTMAEQLGTAAQSLSRAEHDALDIDLQELQNELWRRVDELQTLLMGNESKQASPLDASRDLGTCLEMLIRSSLQKQEALVNTLFSPAPMGHGIPSRLARLWPALVLGPVVGTVTLRIVTRSWDTILAKVQDAKETVRGFAINWVYEPCLKLLDTIRTGDQDGVIMTRESLNSDLQSLERMVADFSAEMYGLKGPALEEVTQRVREGDLTNVLKIYETELKSPLRSAVSGSLVRALLIQVQKVKVDIAVAMRGVDQLLKSQQLLFGAIGIAPAMGIMYVASGFVRTRTRMVLGSQGRAASRITRFRAWQAIKSIDRLLTGPDLVVASSLPPKAQGLLLLDLSLLRRLAPQLIALVPAGSSGRGSRSDEAKRLRSEFLRDVRELESRVTLGALVSDGKTQSTASDGRLTGLNTSDAVSAGLGWQIRRAAVDRMWENYRKCLEPH